MPSLPEATPVNRPLVFVPEVSVGTLLADTLHAFDPSASEIPLTPASVIAASPAARVRTVTLLEEALPDDIAAGAGRAAAKGAGAYSYGDRAERLAAAAKPPSRLKLAVGYVVLLGALLGVSSMGPALDNMTGAAPTTLLFWRAQGMMVFSILGAVVAYARSVFRPKTRRHAMLHRRDVWAMVVMGLTYAAWVISYFMALQMTSVMDAYLFNQSHIVIALVARIATCTKMPRLHYVCVGAIVIGIGLSVCGLKSTRQIVGNVVAFAGSFAAIPFLRYAPRVQARWGLMGASIVMQAGIVVSVGIVSASLSSQPNEGISYEHPFDANNGILGWTLVQQNRLPLWAFTVVAGSIVGMLGYTWVASVLPTITIQAAMLLEPCVSGIIAVITHTGVMPAVTSYIGMGILVVACGVVVATDDTPHVVVDDHHEMTPVVSRPVVAKKKKYVKETAATPPKKKKKKKKKQGEVPIKEALAAPIVKKPPKKVKKKQRETVEEAALLDQTRAAAAAVGVRVHSTNSRQSSTNMPPRKGSKRSRLGSM